MKKKISDKIEFLLRYRLAFIPNRMFQFTGKQKTVNKKIYFYPRLPHRRSVIYKLCKELGVQIISDSQKKYDLAFYWEDSTIALETEKSFSDINAINRRCKDISKEKVNQVFEEAFGYNLRIDPAEYNGRCVIKSNDNAQHDGRIINCPVDKLEPGFVYQKIIDNSVDEKFVKDIRVPVIGESIPLVYFKFKTTDYRFTNEVEKVELHATENVFSESEINNILVFSKKMGMDYGELDILRDNENGKIYIVDVNKTPWGPPAGVAKGKSKFAIKKMSESFFQLLK